MMPEPAVAPGAELPASASLDFTDVYERWFDDVVRWVRALGAPTSDIEDLAQEVFIVVRRKLPEFDGRNLGGWLYGIALRTVSDHRRRAWWKNLFSRRREAPIAEMASPGLDPVRRLEQKEASERVHRLLARMSDKRRRAFVLFELEGYSGEEIAALEQVPVATVWTRLHHARKEFLARLEAEESAGPMGETR